MKLSPSHLRLFAVAMLVPIGGCLAANPGPRAMRPASGRVGVLVMAHGGSPDWNAAVEAAMAPLAAELPTEVAFGMARRETLQEAVDRLDA
jgi:hypothetical protein